jgi:DNA polymerase-3 subunit epsilon
MPKDLIYDTETTGIHYGFKSRSPADPHHPHLVQVSALVLDRETDHVSQSLTFIVKPEGWDIPDEATAVHGITTEQALDEGLPEKLVLETLLELWSGGETLPLQRVSHNAPFDRNVIATAIARHYSLQDFNNYELFNSWMSGRDFCTMRESKSIVGARNVKGALKFPTLAETYQHFFGETFDKAHTANADCVAHMNIYRMLTREAA